MPCYNDKMLLNYDETRCEGKFDIPTLEPVDVVPYDMIPFNYARSWKFRKGCVHFFLDDYQFERVWNRPEENIRLLSEYDCCLTPDFSLYRDMPRAMMIWNVYRSRLFGQMCQDYGLTVIPTIQFSTRATSFDFCFDGLPTGGTVALSSVGVCGDKIAMGMFEEGSKEMLDRVKPKTVLFYGKNIIPHLIPDDVRIVEYKSFSQKQFRIQKG